MTLLTRKLRALPSKEAFWGYAFIAPIIIGFLFFTVIPVISSLYLSLTEYDGLTSPKFIGFDNYIQLFQDDSFVKSVWNSLYFAIGTVPLDVCLALLFACLLNSRLRFKSLYRTAFFIPVIVSMVAVAEVWRWIYNGDYGLINGILSQLGLYEPPWLSSEYWAMPSVMIMSIWKHIGFNIVIFLAALQGISPSLYEAAKIDGASSLQQFRYITVPLLRHTTAFVVIISLINALQVFDQIYIMTSGGPVGSTTTVVYWIYQNAFQFFKQGYASAMAYILFAILFVATLLQLKYARRKDVS